MDSQEFLSPNDISEILNICYGNALALIKYSGIKYVKVGRCYRVNRDVFYTFLESNTDVNIDEFRRS